MPRREPYTQIAIREDVHIALRRRALASGRSIGALASDLIERGLVADEATPGWRPLPPQEPVDEDAQRAWAAMARSGVA